MFSFNKKKQIDVSRATPRLGSKKNQPHFTTRFSLTRMIVVVVVIIFIFFLITPDSFLGKHSEVPLSSGSKAAEESQLETSTDSQPMLEEQSQSETTATKDYFVGPIRLPQSSYIIEQLDSFSKQEEASSSEDAQKENNTAKPFSLQDIVTKPLDFLGSLGYSIRVSVSNNGKKTTFYKLIDSLSRYYVSYSRFPHFDVSTEDGYSWVTEMVQANEMSGTYEYVLRTTAPVAYCGTVQQNGYCYKSDDANAILYVRIDEPSGQDICADQALFLLWSSSDNKTGELCMDQEPTKLGGFEFLPVRY